MPIVSTRGGSLVPSSGTDDGGGRHTQEVSPINRIGSLPSRGQAIRRRDHVGASAGRGGERMIKASARARLLVGLAAIAIGAAACTGSASTGPKQYTIGFSNTGGTGNGFREEQNCTAKAQALASGEVSKITVTTHDTNAAGQLQDLRDLIAKGVNAIVFNPSDPAALNPALAEAKAAGIKTVAVDAYVTDPNTYNLYNNQINYAYLGAKWLFEQLKGKGT